MNNFIDKQQKHLLYKDEVNNQFLLLKNMEIYRKSNTTFGVSCWSKKIYLQLKKEGIISKKYITDDKLFTFETDNANLLLLISTGSHSRRVNRHGRWLKDKEKRLGHKIIPFNPKLVASK